MADTALSTELIAKVHQLFPQDPELVLGALQSECRSELGNELGERVRCAVLKLSQGSLERLSSALDLARRDWRDVLVGAGFAEDLDIHKSWLRAK